MTEEIQNIVAGYDRNQLVHAVIWPQGPDAASATLYDTDGVVLSEVPITEPVKGSVWSALMPQGYKLDIAGCTVISMSGEVVVKTRTDFDTVVVTERAEVSIEETIRRMTVKAMRQERAREERRAQRQAERQQEREDEPELVEDDTDPVTPEDSATEPTTEPEDASNA